MEPTAQPVDITEGRTCPECGAPVPGDAPKGFCPKCLVRLGAEFALTANGASVASKGTPQFEGATEIASRKSQIRNPKSCRVPMKPNACCATVWPSASAARM